MQMGRTLKNQLKDFKVTLSYDKSGKLPPSISSPVIAGYEVKGVVEAVEKYVALNVLLSFVYVQSHSLRITFAHYSSFREARLVICVESSVKSSKLKLIFSDFQHL